METKLFETSRVKKFFDIVYKLNRACEDKYESRCQKEVFVRRTINKWLKGKYIILYAVSDQTETLYRKYVTVTSVRLNLDWTLGTLSANLYDHARPMDIFNSMTIDHNTAISMEGEWIEDPTNYHNKLIEMTLLNIPKKEYVFKSFDWSKYPKDDKKISSEEAMKILEGTISFIDTTEYGAYRQKKQYKGDIMIGSDIIEVKPYNDENNN